MRPLLLLACLGLAACAGGYGYGGPTYVGADCCYGGFVGGWGGWGGWHHGWDHGGWGHGHGFHGHGGFAGHGGFGHGFGGHGGFGGGARR
jgi:hypothetical protein